jgi:hypothetical protein
MRRWNETPAERPKDYDAERHAQERRWLAGLVETVGVFGGLFVFYLVLDRLGLLDLFASVFRWFGQ